MARGGAVNKYVEICHCGHDRATYHEGGGACLGMLCNDCKAYCDRDTPRPKTPPVRPANHSYFCKCYACKLAAQPAPKSRCQRLGAEHASALLHVRDMSLPRVDVSRVHAA